jgi:O-antigen ligase
VPGFIADHPWQVLFGIGYKTLPNSEYLGRAVIADNMYLSMLVETGVAGLLSLIGFNLAVITVCWRAARAGTFLRQVDAVFLDGRDHPDAFGRHSHLLARAAVVLLGSGPGGAQNGSACGFCYWTSTVNWAAGNAA